jgi:hypothetical protein
LPEKGDFEDLKKRVVELEEQMDTTSIEWGDKVRRLEAQMFTNGCELTELKWKTKELRWLENKVRANQKRTYQRNKSQQQHDGQPTPSHCYPTRAATAAATNKVMEETKKEIEAIGKRIAEIED